MGNSELHITEEQLILMSQEGSETAEELLIKRYENLVQACAANYFMSGADHNDVVQEGRIGLHKAIHRYEFEKDASFRTFASTCINNHLRDAAKSANRKKHSPLNESLSFSQGFGLETEEGAEESALEDVLQDNRGLEPETQMLLQEVTCFLKDDDKDTFSKLEKQVLREKLKGLTNQEIADILGRPRSSIDNAMGRIREKVLKYLNE